MKPSDKIGLIVGTNCPRGLYIKEVIHAPSTLPQAVRYALGWALQGIVSGTREECDTYCETSHRVVAKVIAPRSGIEANKEFLCPLFAKEHIQPEDIAQMFQSEFCETNDQGDGLSVEDKRFLGIMESSIHYTDDGHLEMALPVRDRAKELPNNKCYAYRRLMSLKSRFAKDSTYQEMYKSAMIELFQEGYCEEVPRNEIDRDKSVWYLPHFGVMNPNKPGKVRVVYDCAAKYQGICLNDLLISGPDLTNSLIGVLLRFRVHLVAFTADIRGMFHQVRVNKEDRDFLRFLWWPEGETCNEPKVYRMKVHIFGASSSPSCASFALRKAAEFYTGSLNDSSMGTKAVKENMYVDDLCDGAESVQATSLLISDVKAICKNSGFELAKFKSSNQALIENLPDEDRGTGSRVDLDCSSDQQVERTLGVQWCLESDSFCFRIILKDKPLTRRGILSTVSLIFDP